MPYVDPHNYQHDHVDIFISGSHDDRARIELLAGKLEQGGFSIFHTGLGLPMGLDYRDYIQHYLTHCDTILVCWSPNSIESRYVNGEAQFGMDNNRLVACRIARCQPLPPFNIFQTADLSDWRGQADHPVWKQVVALLAHRKSGAVVEFSQSAMPSEKTASNIAPRQTWLAILSGIGILVLGVGIGLWLRSGGP
jgi:hypothetical protein